MAKQLPSYQVGQFVEINGKNLNGRIAYVGTTNFASGQWIGVVLNTDKGKNNGTVRGTSYFKCATNRGIFVRATQLKAIKMADSIQNLPLAKASDATARNAAAATTTTTTTTNKTKTKTATATPMQLPAPMPNSSETTAAAAGATAKVPASASAQHLLKTTKINKPKLITSSSQLALNTAASGALQLNPFDLANVVPPKRSKTTVSPTESFCCTKRASFVETGFLEILRPQFTPGHPLRSPLHSNAPSSAKPAIAALADNNNGNNGHNEHNDQQSDAQLQQLKDEIADLRQLRQEDKRRLHELEKVRLQNEQLLEFKAQIMEQHGQLQRDLQRSRQELRDAQDLKAKLQRELDELADSIELLTLDKEMAEERAETLQIELEVLQERNEELTLDVEILRAEHEGQSDSLGISGNNLETFQAACDIKRLEQYNQRLRETVVRLRDAMSLDKQEIQRATKELETKQSEIAELKKTKELLSNRVEIMESHIIDLKDQVDASLGAETMVVSLADNKLELEERLKMLEDEVTELEALEEIHEQLIESNQELEQDLREELEMLSISVRSLQQQKDAALESVYERDVTIMKFRELVRLLNEQIRDNGNIAAITSEDFSSTCSNAEETQSLDYQQMFTVNKAYGRAIDHQLSAIELRLKKQHIEELLAFMPEKILTRGAEHDVILVLLILQSIVAKLEILCNGIVEKFPATCEFDRDTIFEGYSVQRSAFRSKALYMLRSQNMILQQLLYMLQRCDYESCTHAAIYRSEIEAQEHRIDELLCQHKAGLLDEHTPCDNFERVLGFFNMLYSNLVTPKIFPELVDEQQLHSSFLEVLESAVDSINTNACLIHTVIQLGDEHTDSYLCMQYLTEHMCLLKQLIKKLQRKFAAACNIGLAFSGMLWERMQHIQATNDTVGRVINILSATTADATKELSAARVNFPDNEVCIEHDRLWRLLCLHCTKLGAEEYQLPAALFHRCVQLVQEELDVYANYIKAQESDKCQNQNTVYVRAKANPIVQRAAEVRQRYQDIKTLEHTLVERDKELKSLKYMAKMKQNDFSELQIRKEMAERNAVKQQFEQEQLMLSIADYLTMWQELIDEQALTINNGMVALDERLNSFAHEIAKLKQQFSHNCIQATTTTDETQREIQCLQKLLVQQKTKTAAIQAKHYKQVLQKLEPLHVPQRAKDEEIIKLEATLVELKRQWVLAYITLKPNAATARQAVQQQIQQLAAKILETYLERHPHYAADTHIGSFPKPQLAKLLNIAD